MCAYELAARPREWHAVAAIDHALVRDAPLTATAVSGHTSVGAAPILALAPDSDRSEDQGLADAGVIFEYLAE